MKKDRRFKIDRRLLIAAAAIALIFTIIIFLDQNGQDGRNMAKRISILIRTMLPELFLFAALRFPTMIYSTALAAIGAFWSVYFALLIPAVLLISQNPVSGSSLSTVVIVASCIIGLILAVMSAAEAVSWIRELRDRKKAEDAAEGIDRMTKGLTTFLRPRMTGALAMFFPLVLLTFLFPQLGENNSFLSMFSPKNSDDLITLVVYLLFPVGALLSVLYMIGVIRKYARYVNELKDSGADGQAALDYHRGKPYCKGKVILGSQYIFVEGAGRLTQYNDIVKIYHKYKEGGKGQYWNLIAVKTNGEEFCLVELPYAHNQKNYDDYVRPMLDEIEVYNPEIVIDGAGKFR